MKRNDILRLMIDFADELETKPCDMLGEGLKIRIFP